MQLDHETQHHPILTATGNALATILLFLIVLWCQLCLAFFNLHRWWTIQHICAWCQPQRRLQGAPWARIKTHTICPACQARMLAGVRPVRPVSPIRPLKPSTTSAQ